MVANFLSNALKYSTSPVTVVLELAARARVTVIDRGRGLTAEQAATVFERYTRGPTRGRDGYGLGLYISRKIIDAHRGRLRIARREGGGIAVSCWLPPRDAPFNQTSLSQSRLSLTRS